VDGGTVVFSCYHSLRAPGGNGVWSLAVMIVASLQCLVTCAWPEQALEGGVPGVAAAEAVGYPLNEHAGHARVLR
jgi:hypothetical protein